MNGAAGLVMELGAPGSSAKQLSGLDYGMGLTEVAKGLEAGQSLVVLVVQLFVIAGTFLAPLFALLLLGVLLFRPLGLGTRRACLGWLIGLLGFNVVEMLTILVMATNFYLTSISRLATADVCTQLDGLLAGVYVSLAQSPDGASCAEAEGRVLPGWYVLAAGVVLFNVSAYMIMSVTKAALEDQDGRSKYDKREQTEQVRRQRVAKWANLGVFAGAQSRVRQTPRALSQYANKPLQATYSFGVPQTGHVVMQPPPGLGGDGNRLQFNRFDQSASTMRATSSNPTWASQRSWSYVEDELSVGANNEYFDSAFDDNESQIVV
jgi:hypothetical protein